MRIKAPVLLLLTTACGDFAPGPAVISLSPSAPRTDDDIVVTITEEAFDPEGAPLSYRYRWYRDGEAVPEVSGATLPAMMTAKHELWRVEVVANDGKADGPAMGAEITIENTPPTVSLTIEPSEPLSSEDIVATATVTDPDGDTVDLDWSWTRDSQPTGHSGDTVPSADTSRWQTWEVTAVPSDGDEQGEAATASVEVRNSPPALASVSLSPSEAYEDSVLRAEASYADADYDGVTLHYAWYVDDTLRMEGSASTLGGAYFDKNQDVFVVVTPSDGHDDGEPGTSDVVTILNSPPTASGVSISPAELYESSVATCSVDDLDDPDGDDITASYDWYVDGAWVSSAASVDGSLFSRGDQLICAASVNDGEEDGPSASSSPVTVLNSAPSISSVTLSPTVPREGDTITASIMGGSDDDGDSISYRYTWWINGVSRATSASLSSASFQKHDTVQLEVTPSDGIDDGGAVRSATLTVANSAPTFTDLALSPEDASLGGTLTALPTGWYDADGDPESYRYEWTVDGVVEGSAGTLDLSPFGLGAEVQVEVIAHDGEDAGTVMTSDPLVISRIALADEAAAIFYGGGSEQVGRGLAMSSDLTGDGQPNLLIGAPYSSTGGGSSGTAYIAEYTAAGTVDLSSEALIKLSGAPGSLAAWSVAVVGDVDDDGHEDALIGAPGESTFGTDAGAAYLLLGPITRGGDLNLEGIELLSDAAGAKGGYAVAAAGDVDDDGYDDFLVGAHGTGGNTGSAHLAFGPVDRDGWLSGLDVELTGEASGDYAGWSLSSAGDVDGDGLADILVGAQAESSAGAGTGAAYLVLGPCSASGDLGSLAHAKLTGESTWDYAGYAVAGPGDVDGDGLDDLLVSARWEDSGGSSSGAVYLVLGGVSGTSSLSGASAKLTGSTANEMVGSDVAGAGDLDGDGFADLLLGGEGGAYGGSSSGVVYLVRGPVWGTLALADSADARFEGGTAGDKLGSGVAGNVDLDGDGAPEILLGAPYEDGNGTSSGAALLFLGSDW
jgi:hypothetical protein